jgi:hypothetical protein
MRIREVSKEARRKLKSEVKKEKRKEDWSGKK